MLNNKTVILGITGGIAAYKTAMLASRLKKSGADVHVIMTPNAVNFINPITFESLTGNKCLVDTFDRNFQHNVEHVALAKKADVFMVAPASANTIAKLAYGMADNMLTTTFLACTCPKIIAPAMNTEMYNNQVTQENMDRLDTRGITVIPAAEGYLACGDVGAGKMPEPDVLFSYIEKEIARPKDMAGMRVLVTAGATRESMDPVRFITNHSTGKMGCALAKECMLRGAKVILVKAYTSAEVPEFVQVEDAVTSKDMFEKCKEFYKGADIIIKAAAVSDYRPDVVSQEKVKKGLGPMSIEMERTDDILSFIGHNKSDKQVVCGFSMETENMLENSMDKLMKKNADMIVANNLKVSGAGFGTDTNIVTMITLEDNIQLKIMEKTLVAKNIVDKLIEIKKEKDEF